jgi:hypothetical protein
MTDLERFKELFNSVGVEFEVTKTNEAGDHLVSLEAGKQPKVDGYNGFAAVFMFDFEGKFRELGVWE